VPEPYQVTLTLYNSAGEAVKHFYTGSSQARPISLEIGYLPPVGGSIPISVQIQGIASVNAPPPLTWYGDNDNGQLIQNGMYYFKMEIVDPFGTVTAYSKEVAVLGNSPEDSLEVFNSAGELVKSIPLGAYPGGLSDFNFSGQGSMAGGLDPATGQPQGRLELELKDGLGASHAAAWDGTNQDGRPVASGVYTVKLVRTQMGQGRTVKSKSVTVINALGSPASLAADSARVGPNPLRGASNFVLSYKPAAQGRGCARIYNLAGELVSLGQDGDGGGSFTLPAQGLAAGIYLVEFEIREGRAVLARKGIKAVILR
jgi:flagellar hook assembly protein FlgD